MPTIYESLRAKLKLKQLEARKQLALKRPQAYKLLQAKQAAQLLAGAALTSTLLLTPGASSTSAENQTVNQKEPESNARRWLSEKLIPLLPELPGHFPREIEQKVSILIRSTFGINAVAELNGHRLNHSIGFVGYEQHLKRYPDDNLSLHDDEHIAGIAPGLGAWGYFANSKSELTALDIEREKYYFAVQTLYLPEWDTNTPELSSWYKYRKMIMINPENGKAVVGVVADAGPSRWTGKQFGASPESMKHLILHQGDRKGKVILYLVDDPDDQVPLGPLTDHINSH